MDYKKINDYEVVYLVKENDEEARKIIFNKYIPIVRKLASKYSMSAKWARVDFDDLVQEGLIALNDAIDKYDENSGALFYTFACICVERRILTFCRKMSSNKHYYLNTSLGEEFYCNIKDDKNLDYYFDEELRTLFLKYILHVMFLFLHMELSLNSPDWRHILSIRYFGT